MVGQMIQNILVYVVMINVLEGLVSSESFREIFRFVGGIILIVLCVSPVLSKISDTDKVGQFLQERLFQEDMDQLNIETKLAEGSFEKIMLKQCKEELEKQVGIMAEKEGEEARQVEVKLKKDQEGNLQLKKVTMLLEEDSVPAAVSGDNSTIRVQDIRIAPGTDPGGTEENVRKDADTAKLQVQICKKYELSKKKVIVWRKCGKN